MQTANLQQHDVLESELTSYSSVKTHSIATGRAALLAAHLQAGQHGAEGGEAELDQLALQTGASPQLDRAALLAAHLEAGQHGAKGDEAELDQLTQEAHVAQARLGVAPRRISPPLEHPELRLQLLLHA